MFQPCRCAHFSLHALGLVVCCAFFLLCFLIRFLILRSYMQDWLLQCTHIAQLTDSTCPYMAGLLRRHMKKVDQFILFRTIE